MVNLTNKILEILDRGGYLVKLEEEEKEELKELIEEVLEEYNAQRL